MPSAPKRYQPPSSGGRVLAAPLTRGSAAARGYDRRWRHARESFLADHPLCERCRERGLVVEATVVDHVVPHKGDPGLFWDRDGNWTALCVTCHGKKTVLEDGGFGRKPVTRYAAVPLLPSGEEPF